MDNGKNEERRDCLISEIKTALILFDKGMNGFLNFGNDFRKFNEWLELVHVPILLLSSSLERFLKCLICLILRNDEGNIKTMPYEYKERKGHDLDYLLNRLICILQKEENVEKYSSADTDILFIKEDKALKLIVKALSDFGLGARYYNLDIVLKGKSELENPIISWDKIEMQILLITRGLDGFRAIPQEMRMLETHKEIRKYIENLFNILGKLFHLAGVKNLIEIKESKFSPSNS